MTFGVTPEGFVPKTSEDIFAEVEAAQRANINAKLRTDAESVVGQVNQSLVPGEAELWEVLALVEGASDPARARGAQADALCALTGTEREPATKGRAVLTLGLNAGALVTAGHVAHVQGQPQNRWVTTEDAQNTGGSPATFDVEAEAEAAGVYVANAATITVIATPVSGWTSVTNAEDAAAGSLAETDAALMLRREAELSEAGTGTLPAIRNDLLELRDPSDATGATRLLAACVVEHNPSAFRDPLRRPPKSIEVVVQFRAGLAGDALAAARLQLAAQLLASAPGGAYLYGSQSATVLDANGDAQTVRWTEPTDVDVYAATLVTIDPAAYAGDAAVKAAAVAYGDALTLGQDVVRHRLLAALLAVGGVRDVATLEVGRSSAVVMPLNIRVVGRELARFDTSRVTVATVVAGAP
jgi:uncharacterized phage protein gp47/JayE